MTVVIDLDDPAADLTPLVRALLAGELAVLPTDTVAGLACAAADPAACARVAEAKGRDPGQATAVICASVESLVISVVPELDARAREHVQALLPGRLTLVVPNPAGRYPWLCGPDPSRIGVRVPILAPALASALEGVGGVCASSANRHGAPDPVTVEAVDPAIRQVAAVVVRGGPVPAGRPSTVVDLTGPEPVVLREGAVASATVLERLHAGAAGVDSAPDDVPRREETSMALTEQTLAALRGSGLEEIDPEIAALCDAELERQRDQLELIASENFTWPSILEAVSSVLTNKYAEGLPGKRYYGGCEVVDEVERLAIDRAKILFGAEHANVQAHSGASANQAAYAAVLDPGDTVLGLRLDHGGHLTHGLAVNFSGKTYHFVGYGVDRESEYIDMDEVRRLAQEHRPKLIVAGGSAYPREIDSRAFREVADEVGALLMVDMAHFSGLVAAGLHQNPVPSAHIVTSTTHKTLAGPRSGFILCVEDLGRAVDRSVFPGLQGGPLCHVTAAKAVCFKIAMGEPFRAYQRAVKENAAALAEGLQEREERVLTGGTDTHLVQLDLRQSPFTGKDAEDRLAAARMTVNRNTVPFDERPPTIASGVRIGSPAGTMRGLDADDFREVGHIIGDAVKPGADLPALGRRTEEILRRRPLYAALTAGYATVPHVHE